MKWILSLLICWSASARRIALLPANSRNHISDAGSRNSKHSSKSLVGASSCGVKDFNIFNIILAELYRSAKLHAFVHCINGIVSMITKPQMLRMYARSIISIGAVVENAFIFRNWTKVNNPTGSMGQDLSVLADACGNSPISFLQTVGKAITRPKPTGIRLVNFLPESFWKRFGKTLRSQVLSRNLDHSSVLCASWLQARRAFLLCLFVSLSSTTFCQLPVIPFVVPSSAFPAWPNDPTNISGLTARWIFVDLAATNIVITNWVDEIQGIISTNGNSAARPTNSSLGVGFNGTTFLTNNNKIDQTVSPYSGKPISWFVVLERTVSTGLLGTFDLYSFDGSHSVGNTDFIRRQPSAWNFTGGSGNHVATGSFLTIEMSDDPITVHGYTNGVVATGLAFGSLTPLFKMTGIADTFGSQGMIGYIKEICIWTNVLSGTDALHVHQYATNRYQFVAP